jgi:hypothetical protein
MDFTKFKEKLVKWLGDIFALNAPRYTVYAIGLLTVVLANCRKAPDEKPDPLPIPPTPIIPDFPDGWFPPTPEDKQSAANCLAVARFADTEANQFEIIGDGEDAPVWRLATKGRKMVGRGPIPTYDQGQIGSCVGCGWAATISVAIAAQIAIGKARNQDAPTISPEVIYATSRVDIGKNRVRGSDGSVGAWAAEATAKIGVLAQTKYGQHDLTTYSVPRCKQWGDNGIPAELKEQAKANLAKNVTKISSGDEARKALAQGYAIAVCSNQGFGSYGQGGAVRDKDGFLAARGNWNHCMSIIGYRADRPGFLILNSWGEGWVTGPKGKFDDIPEGSFWAEFAVVDRMLKQDDSYCVSGTTGFPKRRIPRDDWFVNNDQKPVDNLAFQGNRSEKNVVAINRDFVGVYIQKNVQLSHVAYYRRETYDTRFSTETVA